MNRKKGRTDTEGRKEGRSTGKDGQEEFELQGKGKGKGEGKRERGTGKGKEGALKDRERKCALKKGNHKRVGCQVKVCRQVAKGGIQNRPPPFGCKPIYIYIYIYIYILPKGVLDTYFQ